MKRGNPMAGKMKREAMKHEAGEPAFVKKAEMKYDKKKGSKKS